MIWQGDFLIWVLVQCYIEASTYIPGQGLTTTALEPAHYSSTPLQ